MCIYRMAQRMKYICGTHQEAKKIIRNKTAATPQQFVWIS